MTDFLHIKKMRLMEVGKFTRDQMASRTSAQRRCAKAWSKAGLMTDQGHNAGGVGADGVQTPGLQFWNLSLVLCCGERIVICTTSGIVGSIRKRPHVWADERLEREGGLGLQK